MADALLTGLICLVAMTLLMGIVFAPFIYFMIKERILFASIYMFIIIYGLVVLSLYK